MKIHILKYKYNLDIENSNVYFSLTLYMSLSIMILNNLT